MIADEDEQAYARGCCLRFVCSDQGTFGDYPLRVKPISQRSKQSVPGASSSMAEWCDSKVVEVHCDGLKSEGLASRFMQH